MCSIRTFTAVTMSFLAICLVAVLPACEVQGGEALFKDRCQQCHTLPNPEMRSAAEWPTLVEKMSGFMHIAHKKGLTEQQKQEIIDYLQAHAGGKK